MKRKKIPTGKQKYSSWLLVALCSVDSEQLLEKEANWDNDGSF